jgi:hypothetical protein
MATVQEKECEYFGFSKQGPLSKRNVVREIQYGKDSPSDKAVSFGDGYTLMKQRFTYEEG